MTMLPFPHPVPAKVTFQVREVVLAAVLHGHILKYVRLCKTRTLCRNVTLKLQCTAGLWAHKVSFEFLKPFAKAGSAVYSPQSDTSFARCSGMRREGNLNSNTQQLVSACTTGAGFYIFRECVAGNVSAQAYIVM